MIEYFLGQPTGQSAPVLYSVSAGGLIPLTDPAYVAWADFNTANPWPRDETGTPTIDALDAVLVGANQSPSGLSLTAFRTALIAAGSRAAQFLLNQAFTDPIHSAAGTLASAVVTVAGGAPADTSADYAAFNAYAATYGLSPGDFATLVQALKSALFGISTAFGMLEASVAAAASKADLAAARDTYNSQLAAIVTSANAANPPKPIVAPESVAIPGLA